MFSPRFVAFIAVVFWGISFVATKAALREVSPVTLIFCGSPSARWCCWRSCASCRRASAWRQLALMGFVGVFVHQMLQAYGLTMTIGDEFGLADRRSRRSGRRCLSAIVLRERFGSWKVVGLAGGFAGALLVVTRGDFSARVFGRPSTLGDLLIFISTINWAVYSVLGHATIRDARPAPRDLGGDAVRRGDARAVLRRAARLARAAAVSSPTGWGALLFLAIGCSALGYLFWYGALERVEVSRVAALLYAEPLVTFVAAVLLLGERVSGTVIAGGLLVLVSVVIAQYAPEAARTSVPSEEA